MVDLFIGCFRAFKGAFPRNRLCADEIVSKGNVLLLVAIS